MIKVTRGFIKRMMTRIYRNWGKTVPESKFSDIKVDKYYNRTVCTWNDGEDSIIIRIFDTGEIQSECKIAGVSKTYALFGEE